jgi:ABC-type nitrate/sulfonate/bicarbonate transport system permease component
VRRDAPSRSALAEGLRGVPLAPLLWFVLGVVGSTGFVILFWSFVLLPLGWPPISQVAQYFRETIGHIGTYQAILATGLRTIFGLAIGFSAALALGVLTGRTRWGWVAFFFALMLLQKVPAVAMIHVLVKSHFGIGLATTVALSSTVVLTFCWLTIHHRARTLDEREVFALRVAGFRGFSLRFFGLLPHLGSTLGGAARLGAAIALVLTILGEWQGVWSDGSLWQHGLGIEISRAYDAFDSQARVLAYCVWLGFLGVLLDGLVQAGLAGAGALLGMEFKR